MLHGANIGLRANLRAKGIPLWRVAETIGVSEMTMTRWMRTELDDEKLGRIKEAVSVIERGESNA